MPRSAADLVNAAKGGARAWALRPDADEQEILRLAGTQGGAERDAALVLWAAGALRRRYHGGPWAWDLLHDGLPVTAREQLRDRVQRGLRSLGRTPAVGKVGQQLWLSTLIAEAGLPGALLGKPDGPVHLWCRGVLSDLQRFGVNGDAEEHAELAVDRARLRAPRHAAWVRDEGVAELVGLLCLEVRRLHPAGGGELPPGDGPEVVAWLDQLDPDWRQRLPIDLSDGDAVGMLRALLGDIAAEARRPDNLRVRAELWGPGPDGAFGLDRRVMVPGTLTEKQLRDLFALPEEVILPPRLTLRVVGGERLALLLKAGECWEAHCGPDVAPAGAGTVRLELLGAPGGARVAVGLPGSDALPEDRPWVFGASGPGGRALLVALGPMRSRDPALRVALPPGARVMAGQARRVGKLNGRLVLEVEEPVTLRLEDGEEVVLLPRHDGREDEPGALVVRGPRHPWSPPEVDVLFAAPGQLRVLWVSESGSVALPPHDQLWHRPQGGCGANQPWANGLPTRSGRWRLRWSRGERRDDALLWLLLPTQNVQLADLSADGGRLVPVGDPVPILSLRPVVPGVLHLADRGGLRLSLLPGGRPPGWLRVQLNFPHGVGHELPLELPFPARRAGVLQRSGAWGTEAIALELLAGCRAQALDPGAKAAWIDLRGPGGGGLPDSTVRLPALGPAWSLDLEALRADVARRLAHHPSPDAAVELRVITDAPTALRSAPVKVQRYTRRVVVGEHADLRLEPPAEPETLRTITLQAHRLDAIAAPVALPRLHPGARWAQQPELRA